MNSGTINLTDDAVIAANKATSNGEGGGIYVNSGVLNLHGGTVASNWVDSGYDCNGGGIYVNSGTISMTDGYVTNNSQYGGRNDPYCQNGGGGIAFKEAQMYMSGGYITGNYAVRPLRQHRIHHEQHDHDHERLGRRRHHGSDGWHI